MATTSVSAPDVRPPAGRPAGVTGVRWLQLAGPALVVVATTYLAATTSPALRYLAEGALCTLVMVLALQTFIGNSGVLSFGHSAFALVGGFTTGLMTMPERIKRNLLGDLLPPLQSVHSDMWTSLVVAVVMGALLGTVVGLLLMRLNGLAAGIGTFAVLMVADNVFFNSQALGPGPQAMPQIPTFAYFDIALVLALVALVVTYLLGTSRAGRLLRASREDFLAAQALGVSIWRLRVLFFAASAGMAALAGAMYAHHAAAVTARDFYLGYAFTTLAMLVIGGMRSMWGAVVGTLTVTAIGEVLLRFENGVEVGSYTVSLPTGARGMVIAAAFVLMLVWRPQGLTGGREFSLAWLGRLGRRARAGEAAAR